MSFDYYYYVYGDDKDGNNVLIYKFWAGNLNLSEVWQAARQAEKNGEFKNVSVKEVEERPDFMSKQ